MKGSGAASGHRPYGGSPTAEEGADKKKRKKEEEQNNK